MSAAHFKNPIPAEKCFVVNSPYKQSTIKPKILKLNLMPYECKECKNQGFWGEKKLVLQLDHKNGDNTDNRLENLRFLCPNCHSQTDTFCRREPKTEHFCPCGARIRKRSKTCRKCLFTKMPEGKRFNTVINWPTNNELKKLVWTRPLKHIAKLLNCSIAAIQHHCQIAGIDRPTHGFWQKSQNKNAQSTHIREGETREPNLTA
jgi:hypothetical protein